MLLLLLTQSTLKRSPERGCNVTNQQSQIQLNVDCEHYIGLE